MKLQNLRKEIVLIAEKINAPSNLFPTLGSPIGDATPNIEVDNSGNYHFVVSERGNEYERKVFEDENELLYLIFSGITFSMACDFELKNRNQSEDFRKQIFEKQFELMNRLKEEWGEKIISEHQDILKTNPYTKD
ncbi:Imm63 family immunity protein [Wenyingzhuangia sp. IMCC45574]